MYNTITKCNVYLNGVNQAGRASEVTLPDVTEKTAEHVAIGRIGAVSLPLGVLEMLTAKIKWMGMYDDLFAIISDTRAVARLQVRGIIESVDSGGNITEKQAAIFMNSRFKSNTGGAIRSGDKYETESTFYPFYIKKVIDGVVVEEIDLLACIHKLNGVDLHELANAFLGL